MTIVDLLLASSAAPTFFPTHKVSNDGTSSTTIRMLT